MSNELAGEFSSKYFHTFKTGTFSVIGFDARYLTDERHKDECLQNLVKLVDLHDCQILAVDLENVGLVSSWILGVLAAVHKHGIEVCLYHPSPEIQGVLQVTHLDELLSVRGEVT